jgi:hypothetical protein
MNFVMIVFYVEKLCRLADPVIKPLVLPKSCKRYLTGYATQQIRSNNAPEGFISFEF